MLCALLAKTITQVMSQFIWCATSQSLKLRQVGNIALNFEPWCRAHLRFRQYPTYAEPASFFWPLKRNTCGSNRPLNSFQKLHVGLWCSFYDLYVLKITSLKHNKGREFQKICFQVACLSFCNRYVLEFQKICFQVWKSATLKATRSTIAGKT